MTTRTRRAADMILPAYDPSNGTIISAWWQWRDTRIPSLKGHLLDSVARVVGFHRRSDGTCSAGRHLFDAIEVEAADPRTCEQLGDEYGERWVKFRLTLTCVRCGIIESRAGLRDYDEDGPGLQSVTPIPLQAGDLQAQEISRVPDGGRPAPLSTWTIHDGTTPNPVGQITWAMSPRGRRYVVGRLESWPQGRTIEAPTAQACLRKIAQQASEQVAPGDQAAQDGETP